MKLTPLALILTLTCVACTTNLSKQQNAQSCMTAINKNFDRVLPCYHQTQAARPLSYSATGTSIRSGIKILSYDLTSQSWSPNDAVTPAYWSHQVNIFIPEKVTSKQALLVINNGSRGTPPNPDKAPTDFSAETLQAIAQKTHSIIVAINNVPNQPLLYQGDSQEKSEDASVAYSWAQFLDAPQKNAFMPLQIPMMAAVTKAMDLAEQELKPWDIHRFIVTGISKRGWTSWHTAIVDSRVDAIVPFVFDALDFSKFMARTYQTYGHNWPIALAPYYQAGIPTKQGTPDFESLIDITDPFRYLSSDHAKRLSIPKYIVNTSGDDFFAPDSARFYIDQLPGATSLRVIPNSDHFGVRPYTQEVLVNFINRFQNNKPLPTLSSRLIQDAHQSFLTIRFSEQPVSLTQWTAMNPLARDFRYACGIRYKETALALTATVADSVRVPLPSIEKGWLASFVEARFADGTITTTPVYITPDGTYPVIAPPNTGGACQTLPIKTARQ